MNLAKVRINKVLRELDISLNDAIEFLNDNNVQIKKSINSQLTLLEVKILSKITTLRKVELMFGQKLQSSKTVNEYNTYLLSNGEIVGLNIFFDQFTNLVDYNFSIDTLNYLTLGTSRKIEFKLEQIRFINFLSLTDLNLYNLRIIDNYSLRFFENLRTLRITKGDLEDLNFLENMDQLAYIDIHDNKISDLHFISYLENLRTLNLSNNRIKHISNLRGLPKLQQLFLNRNGIASINGLEKFENIELLDLSRNNLISAFECTQLGRLKILNLSYNNILNIDYLQNLELLEYLDISHTSIVNIQKICLLPNLGRVFLNNLKLVQIENLSNLKGLLEVSLSDCDLQDITFLATLKNLQSLNLHNNQVRTIEPLRDLKELKSLTLSKNIIADAEPLLHLDNLEILNLSSNNISDLSFLKSLMKITYLDLSNNVIKNIRYLKRLTSLKYLNLNSNDINDISNLSIIAESVNEINIYNNPFVFEQGWKLSEVENHLPLLKNYFSNQVETQINITLPAKVLLLGNHASGKSTLLHYLLQEKYSKRLKERSNSTHIIQIAKYPRTLKKEDLPEVVYFDFGGQDYYHGIYKAFLSNDTLNVLLWNCNSDNNKLRKDTRDFSREYWLNQLKFSFNKNRKDDESEPVLLVQTYADDLNSRRQTYNDADNDFLILNEFYISLKQTVVSKNKIFASALNYLEVQITEEAKKKQKVIKRPQWFLSFLKEILSSENYDSTPLDEIKNFYRRELIDEETDSDIVEYLKNDLDQLHKQGLILYYSQQLPEIAWLNPMETVQHIHDNILSREKLKDLRGIVRETEFIHDKNIIKLLELQKVIFHDKANKQFIIPNYLPLSTDFPDEYEILKFGLNQPDYILKFTKFLPFGLVNQLICYFGNNPDSKRFWRDQIIFTLRKESKILIKLDFASLEIQVYFNFINDDSITQDEIKRYIFESILFTYWDQDIYRLDDNNLLRSSGESEGFEIPIEDIDLDKSTITFPDFDLRDVTKIKVHPVEDPVKLVYPEDLYISIDGIHYINAKEFNTAVDHQEARLKTYTFNGVICSNSVLKPVFDYFLFTNKKISKMKKIFISYSKDDLSLVHQFLDHLSSLKTDKLVSTWYCTHLVAGGEWDKEIQKHFDESDLICLMISSNFLKTEYIQKYEVNKAFERKRVDPNFKIIPIILNFCSWTTTENNLGRFTALPYTAKPVCDFYDKSMAWYIVVECIKYLILTDSQPEGEDWFNESDLPKSVKQIYERIVKGLVNNNSPQGE